MSEEKELHDLLRDMVARPFTGEPFGVDADARMIRTIILVMLLFGSSCTAISLLLAAYDVVRFY